MPDTNTLAKQLTLLAAVAAAIVLGARAAKPACL